MLYPAELRAGNREPELFRASEDKASAKVVRCSAFQAEPASGMPVTEWGRVDSDQACNAFSRGHLEKGLVCHYLVYKSVKASRKAKEAEYVFNTPK